MLVYSAQPDPDPDPVPDESEHIAGGSMERSGSGRWAKIRMALHEDIIGSLSSDKGHNRSDYVWYKVDPYKAEQMVRAPKNYNPANKYFGTVYFLGVVLFGFYAFYEFFTRPVIETYSLRPSFSVSSIPVDVTVHCSNTWKCSVCDDADGWSDGWICANGTITWTSISQQYDNTKAGYCEEADYSESITGSMSAATPSTTSLTACYSTAFADGILIHVPFAEAYSEGSTRLIITITSPGTELFYEQELEPAQRKSVFLGQTLYENVDGSKSREV
jgi:hypothetical protein